MAASNRRSSTSVAVPKSLLEEATLTLQDLPEKPKENLSLKEAISQLHNFILTAFEKGYSLEEVAAILTDKGVDVTPSSLKYHLSRIKQKATGTPRAKARKPRRVKDKGMDSAPATLRTEEIAVVVEAPPEPVKVEPLAEPAAEPAKKRPAPRRSSTPAAKPASRSAAKAKTNAKTTSTSTSSRRKKKTDA